MSGAGARRTVAAVALALLATACGSTVPPGSTSFVQPGEGTTGQSAAPGDGPQAPVPGGTGGGSGGPAGATGPATVGSGGGGTGGTGSVSSGGGAPVAAAAPIAIGVPRVAGVAEGAAALGVKGFSVGDTDVQWKLLLNDANARGGLLGHRLVPVIYDLDYASATPLSTQEQAACEKLTRDNKVFAAVVLPVNVSVLADCLKRAGALALTSPGYSRYDSVWYRTHPHMLGIGTMNLTRVARTYIDGLVAAGFFAKGAVIGLVRWEDSGYNRATEQVLKPALAAHGLRLADEVLVPPTNGVSDAGPNASASSSAVLRFQTARVDHVLFLGIGGSPDLFFMKAAESQAYYPKYGLSSNDWAANLIPNVSQETLRQFWGSGWYPQEDVGQEPAGAAAVRCKTLMAKGGQQAAYDFCDTLNVFLAAALRGGQPLSASSVIAGSRQAGTIDSILFSQLSYASARPEGVTRARPFRYVESCSCLRYFGVAFSAP